MSNAVKIMPKARSTPPHRVVAVAYQRLCIFEFSIVRDLLGSHPDIDGPWYEFLTAGGEEGPLRATASLVVEPQGGLELLETADTIVVPGWRQPRDIPQRLAQALASAHRRGTRVVSICGGAFALAEAGILDGRRATTHWHSARELAQRYPKVKVDSDVLYVDEGDVMTSAGASAGIDLCLHMVRKDFGAGPANILARSLVVPLHRGGSQAQYVPRPILAHQPSRLTPVLDWIRASLGKELSIENLSQRANMSTRTFIRHFTSTTGMSPGEWILGERLALARELLETSTMPIEEVAHQCGLGTAATLRHHFRRRLNTTPTAHRSQFNCSGKDRERYASQGQAA